MRRSGLKFAFAFGAIALLGGCTGVHVGQARPPGTRPLREVAREERGVVVTVRDTQLDLRTGMARGVRTSSPTIPVFGPIGMRVPITVGGEKRVEVPAEEITVRLASGKTIAIVQELSSPPFAPGERVRVQHEKVEDGTTAARIQVVRE